MKEFGMFIICNILCLVMSLPARADYKSAMNSIRARRAAAAASHAGNETAAVNRMILNRLVRWAKKYHKGIVVYQVGAGNSGIIDNIEFRTKDGYECIEENNRIQCANPVNNTAFEWLFGVDGRSIGGIYSPR